MTADGTVLSWIAVVGVGVFILKRAPSPAPAKNTEMRSCRHTQHEHDTKAHTHRTSIRLLRTLRQLVACDVHSSMYLAFSRIAGVDLSLSLCIRRGLRKCACAHLTLQESTNDRV